MRRLRLIEATDGSVSIRDAETDTLWGFSPAGTIEAGFAADAFVRLPEVHVVVLRSARLIDDAVSSFATWSNAGWATFDARLHAAIEQIERADPGLNTVLWPGSGSILSDGVSTLSFARKHPHTRLMIDPVAWITDSMRGDAEDHLMRFGQALSLCESLDAVVVRGLDTTGSRPTIGADTVEALLTPALDRAGVLVRA
ncbi:MAG: hypothetical protein AAGA55_11590 [Planctomycetota bacterium]